MYFYFFFTGSTCATLERLDISGLSASSKQIRTLADRCGKLQWIQLNNCLDVGEKG